MQGSSPQNRTGAGSRIAVLIPGLFGPIHLPPEDLPPLPTLERLLARADRLSGPSADPLVALARRFGVQADDPGELPSAAFCRLADDPGTDPAGYWLHADPVHLRPDRDQLLLFEARHIELTRAEADALVDAFNAHFGPDGLYLDAPVPDRWYLRLDTEPRIRTRPLHAAVGRGIGRLMPEGADRPRWISLVNEVQMLLHHAPENQARERAGRLTANGVWPWGGGRLPPVAPFMTGGFVYADHPFARGLARAAGAEARPLPADPHVLAGEVLGGDGLVFWDELWPAVLDGDPAAWMQGITRAERLAAELWAAVRRGRVARLDLDPCDGSLFRLTRTSPRRFWRRPRAFGRWLAGPG